MSFRAPAGSPRNLSAQLLHQPPTSARPSPVPLSEARLNRSKIVFSLSAQCRARVPHRKLNTVLHLFGCEQNLALFGVNGSHSPAGCPKSTSAPVGRRSPPTGRRMRAPLPESASRRLVAIPIPRLAQRCSGRRRSSLNSRLPVSSPPLDQVAHQVVQLFRLIAAAPASSPAAAATLRKPLVQRIQPRATAAADRAIFRLATVITAS